MDEAPREFQYGLSELPPGRVPFRRWRWELWHGARLVRCGWRLSPADAERALRTAASRRAHELIGVRPLRPERTRASGSFATGSSVRVDCGAVTCVLVPRRDEAAAVAA
ncbi:MAG: hypothetical protein QOC95_2515 [Thermoleophilaceae bacterium]|jgi:hypothetical protein|nr:hypothetical protein [Thermoleophilaceae bacterium]